MLRTAPPADADTPDLAYCRGLALAHRKRMREARAAFEAGGKQAPRDTRFLIELAGLDYQEKNFAGAKARLRRALRLDPADDYANDFLASIYFIEGNLEAALRFWNCAGKPRLIDFSFDPEPALAPRLRDRAFPFALGKIWKQSDFRAEQALAERLRIFSRTNFELAAQSDGNFRATFRSTERDPWTSGKWLGFASLARGAPYLTLYPEFYNLNHAAFNWTSLLRWDDEKRRVFSQITTPLGDDPRWNVRVYFDGRNENWDVTRTLVTPVGPFASMNLEKAESGFELGALAGGRLAWTSGMRYAYRRYRNVQGIPPATSRFFSDGSSVEYDAGANYQAWRIPERRFNVTTAGDLRAGRTFAASLGGYARILGSLTADWFPRARGEDYEILTRFRAGRTFGGVPFDELFVLGLERDNDLWLRGHVGTRDGKKGSAPLGRNYALFNWELDKIVHQWTFFTWKVGPWLDSGEISDPSGIFGSREWLWDAGVQTKLRVLGSFEVVFSYGRDLRNGGNAFYAIASH